MLRENSFHADTIRHLAYCEGFGNSGSTLLYDDALENLNTLFASFFYFIMDLDRIAYAIIGKVGSDLVSADCLQNIHGSSHLYFRK